LEPKKRFYKPELGRQPRAIPEEIEKTIRTKDIQWKKTLKIE
jgi:hypothetical protein